MKTLIFMGMTVGSILGGYIPTLFGVDFLSYSSLLGSSVGAIIGMVVTYKLANF